MNYVDSMEFENAEFKCDSMKCKDHIEQDDHVYSCCSEKDCAKSNASPPPTKLSFNENPKMRAVRLRTLLHWPHVTPSRDMMAQNGWFMCNVGDRVICIYCDTICQGWTAHDDPAEVHERLAPQCPLIKSICETKRNYNVINETIREKFDPHHRQMSEMARRQMTFSKENWTIESPSVDDLVRAGFFHSAVGNVVTCFYCNGSLHKWGSNDNPMIEHARWFPSCLYAKHLCGDVLHERIQISNKKLLNEKKIDENQLIRLVSSRLDLPNVVALRSRFPSSIVKRCLENQFRLNNEDFVTDVDFATACLILKKQVDVIQGRPENIIIPSKHSQQKQQKSIEKKSLGECSVCLTEEKQLACMPCGHLCACVPCGYALKTCPICRVTISSFIRINS